MSAFCTTCGYQQDFCRCPMKTQDLILCVAIFCIALAFAVAMWMQDGTKTVPPDPQEQGYRAPPPAVRRIPPPRPQSIQA